MDSPLILDGATRFGRGLEMDRDFPVSLSNKIKHEIFLIKNKKKMNK